MAKGTAAPAADPRLAALQSLKDYGSHAGHTLESASEITRAFGFEPMMHTVIANDPKNPKGLWIEGKPARFKVQSLGGWELARQIAHIMGVKPGEAYGRGTEFHRTVENIEAALKAESSK